MLTTHWVRLNESSRYHVFLIQIRISRTQWVMAVSAMTWYCNDSVSRQYIAMTHWFIEFVMFTWLVDLVIFRWLIAFMIFRCSLLSSWDLVDLLIRWYLDDSVSSWNWDAAHWVCVMKMTPYIDDIDLYIYVYICIYIYK